MKKKIIPVVLAIVLILIIGCVSFGGIIIDKYSYFTTFIFKLYLSRNVIIYGISFKEFFYGYSV